MQVIAVPSFMLLLCLLQSAVQLVQAQTDTPHCQAHLSKRKYTDKMMNKRAVQSGSVDKDDLKLVRRSWSPELDVKPWFPYIEGATPQDEQSDLTSSSTLWPLHYLRKRSPQGAAAAAGPDVMPASGKASTKKKKHHGHQGKGKRHHGHQGKHKKSGGSKSAPAAAEPPAPGSAAGAGTAAPEADASATAAGADAGAAAAA